MFVLPTSLLILSDLDVLLSKSKVFALAIFPLYRKESSRLMLTDTSKLALYFFNSCSIRARDVDSPPISDSWYCSHLSREVGRAFFREKTTMIQGYT